MATKPKRNTQALSDLFKQAGEGAQIINNGASEAQDDTSLRVQYLNIQLLRPDPVQPRRILPHDLHTAFHSQQISPNQALRELVNRVQGRARVAGRPFSNPFELVGDVHSEEASSSEADYSVEEVLLRDLVQLAITLQGDGQVNPLTVVNISEGVMTQYVIETGERRFWATWLLRDFHPVESHDGKIPCIVVPGEKASPFRQAKENTSRSGLNAIAMARQVALLLLAVHGYDIPLQPVSMDFYRQALDLDLRGKREHTADVLAALGGISKRQLSGYKSLLKLCDEALEVSDRYSITESILVHVAQLEDDNDQVELLHQVLENNLTRKQVRDIVEKGYAGVTNSDDALFDKLPKAAVQIAKLALKPTQELDANKLAQALVGMEQDKQVAKARIRALRDMLEEAERYLD
jgi:Trp operon repressor